ncbi:unnamed protein product [marine sediment metagenome]|uniref:DUF2314 domain-containing protein n=1 Tax=marine sediment metagenome TaxID=412755 RepID=X1RBC3_9ZZZZ
MKDNIVIMHKECSDNRKKEFQTKFDRYNIQVNGFVKIKFDGETPEHMWIRILSINHYSITGILVNHPILLDNISIGDIVECLYQDIEDYSYHGDD